MLQLKKRKKVLGKFTFSNYLNDFNSTQLVNSSTDLRYFQELLGHNSSRTTEIYTHVSTKSLQKIKSPFDDL
ncbi:tyrosine-type recombinase/integrase [Algoriphagus iocasae]|uniref:tyrosine-type recombinase/integrase n=1 Tax=Algoriphagus iocasae TaxID=1836499 RepID=UPI001FE3286E